jgi:hypothetical protein
MVEVFPLHQFQFPTVVTTTKLHPHHPPQAETIMVAGSKALVTSQIIMEFPLFLNKI